MPSIIFDGTNGQEIASYLTDRIFGGTSPVPGQSEIAVNKDYPGPALELDWYYPDGQKMNPTAYHIPLGYVMDTDTGQVFSGGDLDHTTPLDIEDLRVIA